MRSFAAEVSRVVHDLGSLEIMAIKTASLDDCALTQEAIALSSEGVYGVIVKRACDEARVSGANHFGVVGYIVKMAQALGRPAPSNHLRAKLAAVVLADSALVEAQRTSTASEKTKYASARKFGQEYFVELLREVL